MVSARDLTTRRQVAASFIRSASARVIGGFLIASLATRLWQGSPGWGDVAGVLVVVVLLGPVEWVIHRWLLHARPGNVLGEALGTRESHVLHHRDPDDLDWLLLRGPNAIGSCLAIVLPFVGLGFWASVSGLAAADRVWPTTWTTIAAGLAALLHYEWVHLLVHSRYRPTSRYYARLDRNHRLHHYRNENYWLGVTVDVGDRLLHTLPASRDAVPLSDTARALPAD